MGIAERKEAERALMRRRILESAMRLFLEEGFENVSMRRIAESIEYSPATIYLYFKDKNEIFYALHAMGLEKLYERQQSILAVKDPWKRLRKHGEVYVSFALENPEYYDLIFIMRGVGERIREDKCWDVGSRSFEFLKQNVRECIEAGYLEKTNLDMAAFAFWSVTHGIASLVIRDRCVMFPPEGLSALIENTLDFILKSMGPKKPGRAKGRKHARKAR